MREGLVYKLEIVGTPYFLYGSTINLKSRIKRYGSDLRNNKYGNSFVQNVYNKYNNPELRFIIVQENIPEEILLFVEDIWIGANSSKVEDKKGGMNLKDASRPLLSKETLEKISFKLRGRKFSDNHKKNLSKSQKGVAKPQSEENRYKARLRILEAGKKLRKKVQQIDIKTNLIINTFSSISEAGRKLNISRQGIGLCCRNSKWVKSAGGYKWQYGN